MPVDDERIVFGFFPKRAAPFLSAVPAIAFRVMDEEALQKPPQQDYYVVIYERKRLTGR